MSMNFQMYEDKSTFLFKLDPRIKILGLVLAFYLSIVFSDPFFLGGIFFSIFILVLSGGVPLKRVMILLKGLAFLALISVIMWPMFYREGNIVLHFWVFDFTDEGIAFGIAMSFRILCMVLSSISMMLITSQRDLILGLRRLGLPYKASFAFATALRFLPMMTGIGQTINEAQRARALDLDKGFIKKVKNNAAILAPLIVEAIRLSQQLVLSVEARGFARTDKKTTLVILKFSNYDKVVLALMILIVVTSIAVRVLGYGYIN